MFTLKLDSGLVDLLVTIFAVLLLEPLASGAAGLWSEWSNTRTLMRTGRIYGKPSRCRRLLEKIMVVCGARAEFGDRWATMLTKLVLRIMILAVVFLASAFKNGESRAVERSVSGGIFAFDGVVNDDDSFAVRSGCVIGTATNFALKTFLVGEDGVFCDKDDDRVVSYEEVGSLDGAEGELLCVAPVGVDSSEEQESCLTVRDSTTLCDLTISDRFATVSSTECAVIKVAGVDLKDVARRILEVGVSGGATSQEKLLTNSVRFAQGVRNIPRPGVQERVTKVGYPFMAAVLVMGALTIMSFIAIFALRLLLKRLPVHAPTSTRQMAMSWLDDVEGPNQQGDPKRSADLELIRDETSKASHKIRISCGEVNALGEPDTSGDSPA